MPAMFKATLICSGLDEAPEHEGAGTKIGTRAESASSRSSGSSLSAGVANGWSKKAQNSSLSPIYSEQNQCPGSRQSRPVPKPRIARMS